MRNRELQAVETSTSARFTKFRVLSAKLRESCGLNTHIKLAFSKFLVAHMYLYKHRILLNTSKNAVSLISIRRHIMNRPRNRQARPPRNNSRNDSKGFGRGLRTDVGSNVPSGTQVVPGATVSIVQKVDQPTGREVQGVVRDLLTRGDHPRGIKVRLQDGRIGRVQRMASADTSTSVEVYQDAALTGTHVSPSEARDTASERLSTARTPSSNTSSNLGDYVIAHKKKRNGRSPLTQETSPSQSTGVVICPICGDFEGDEAAVSYHVEQHLDTDP